MRAADVVRLLPAREAATLEAWLTAHPGARVICRDRADNYAEGARDSGPDAIRSRSPIAGKRYAEIRGRLDADQSLSAISRVTGLDRKTVQRFARADSAEELLVMRFGYVAVRHHLRQPEPRPPAADVRLIRAFEVNRDGVTAWCL